MSHRSASCTGREYKVREDQNLLSRTDEKGCITYATQSFIDVSGYSREELIGSPHNIVRHPDMPKEAFANLWDTLRQGQVWVGLVKNRRKNGDHYWVRAHVTPIIENGTVQGYTSVRVKPTLDEIMHADDAYARLRNGDRGIRLDRGQIVQTGLIPRLQRMSLRSLRGRVIGAIAVNTALFGAAFALRHATTLSPETLQALTSALILTFNTGMFLSILKVTATEIDQATRFAMQIAAGNLAAEQPVSSNEFGRLTGMLSVMQRSLANIAHEVRGSLDAVSPASAQVAAGSHDLASRTEQQAASLQHTAASMEEITSTTLQNADNARQARRLAEAAATEVRASGTAMQEVVSRMTGISSSSQKIADIISVIDAIAFQTNLLALNASVEAARAGEQGRGFAVVAQEVRSLASRSAEAAEQVRRLIQHARQEVALGEDQVQRAETAISGVIQAVLQVNDIMGEIACASDEQNRGIEQVNVAVAQMDEVTQRNTTLVVESARSAQTMEDQMANLTNSINVLRLPGSPAEDAMRAQSALPRSTQAAESSEPDPLAGARWTPQRSHPREIAHDLWVDA